MDVQWLRSFVEVASQQSVSRAARRLGYSQPTVTQHLQRVERLVGGALVVRVNGGVALTDFGAHILPLARLAIMAVDEMTACSGQTAPHLRPSIGNLNNALLIRAEA